MRSGKSGTSWSQLWKRNAVVVAIALFVCAAVYLNWNYEQEAQAGKTLGQSTMVGSETGDPLVKGGGRGQFSPAGQLRGDRDLVHVGKLLCHRPAEPAAGQGQRPVSAPGRRRP